MVTGKETAQAIATGALQQAYDGRYDGLSTAGQILTDSQVNEKLLMSEWESNKLTAWVPKTVIKEAYVLLENEEGQPIMHNGVPVVKRRDVPVFNDWEKKTIEIPAGNIFKSDLRTAISSDMDVNMLNKLINLYFYVIEYSITSGEDCSYDIFKIYNLIGAILNTSNTKYGKTLEMAKTSITKGVQENIIRQMLLDDQRKRGLLGGFRKKLPF